MAMTSYSHEIVYLSEFVLCRRNERQLEVGARRFLRFYLCCDDNMSSGPDVSDRTGLWRFEITYTANTSVPFNSYGKIILSDRMIQP